MAAVNTPYELRLSWSPVGSMPAVATGVHGSYHVIGSGPYDVFYRTRRDQQDLSEKIGARLNASDAYQLCVAHNKATLRVLSPVEARTQRHEQPCTECGLMHAGQC